MAGERSMLVNSTPGLVDILDRILDKGLVVAGDIRISLANVELLTIQIRLLVCSIDKAEQIGVNWWRYDRSLGGGAHEQQTIAQLQQRVTELEAALAAQVARQVAQETPERGSTITADMTSAGDDAERPDMTL
jgi:hypothetical protein